MTRTRTSWARAVMVCVVLLPVGRAHAAGLSYRASLAGIQGVGKVIVTVSAASKASETEIQQLVEGRLESAGIAIDPTLDTHLVAEVEVTRDTSNQGHRHYTFLISLSLQEPVRTTRAPRSTFRATTWSSKGRIQRFGSEVPPAGILDSMEDNMNLFLGSVAKDTAAWKATSPDAGQ